jgi:hypothetical protein
MHVLNVYPSLRAQTSPSRAEIPDQVRYDEGRTLHYPINGRGNKTTDVLTIILTGMPVSASARATRGMARGKRDRRAKEEVGTGLKTRTG